MTQQAEGVGNREVVLEHEVYDIIGNTCHYFMQGEKAINDPYYGVGKVEVIMVLRIF